MGAQADWSAVRRNRENVSGAAERADGHPSGIAGELDILNFGRRVASAPVGRWE